MATRIRELKDNLVEQTALIQTLRAERDRTKEMAKKMHLTLVKYRPEYISQAEGFGQDYPVLRAEGAEKMSTEEFLQTVGAVFSVLAGSIADMSKDLKEMYRELDQSVDDAMEQWKTVRAQESSNTKATIFRDPTLAPTQDRRAKTPEVPLVDRPRADSGTSTPTPLVVPKGKTDTKQSSPVKKKASKLETVLGIDSASKTSSKA